jgi:predicted Abi (CAAX) family protease
MFREKWSKIYERKFVSYEDGYRILTFRGAKFISPAQKNKLVSSYSSTLKIDFLGLLKATLLVVVIIAIGVTAVDFLDLPKSVSDVISKLSVIAIMVVAFRPLWNHLKLSHEIFSAARPLPQSETWLGSQWNEISWARIGIGLTIYGFFLYHSINEISLWPMDWALLFWAIFLGFGTGYLFCAAIWKLSNHLRSKSD